MTDLIIHPADVKAAKVCMRGACAFLRRHGHDPRDFLKNGIAADKLIATGDAIAARVVEVAKNGRRR